MLRSLRSFAVLAALALPVLAAHADTFAGSVSFSDNGPRGNGLSYSGSFASPTFSFTGPVGTTFTDRLTITATQINLGQTSDDISVSLLFTLPGDAADTISGTGTNYFSLFGLVKNNQIDWTNNVSLINFANGAQLSASLPDFTFSSFSLDSVTSGSENLTLTVTKTAVTPEPSSLALLGTGLLSTCCVLRRRLAL